MANVTIVLKNVEGYPLSEVFDAFRASLDYDSNKVILTEESSCHFFFNFEKAESGDILFNVVNK